MELIKVRPGTFLRGAPENDREAWSDEKPQHQVLLTKGFLVGKYPVTQREFKEVMGYNPSHFKYSEDLPVEYLRRDEAILFCNTFSKHTGLQFVYDDQGNILKEQESNGYRLLTATEWEYVCKAGSEGRCYGKLDDIAWYKENSAGKTHLVGQKDPNDWGLHDMIGNVDEWVYDNWVCKYTREPKVNPLDRESENNFFLVKGGSFVSYQAILRASFYRFFHKSTRDKDLGFRVCRTI